MSVEAGDIKAVLEYIENIKEYDSLQSYHLLAVSELSWIFFLCFAGVMDYLLSTSGSQISTSIPWLFSSFGGAAMAMFIFSSPNFISEQSNVYKRSLTRIMKLIFIGMLVLWMAITGLVLIFGTDLIIIAVTFSVALAHLFFKRRHTKNECYSYNQFVYLDSHWVFLSMATIVDLILYSLYGAAAVPFFSLIFPLAYSVPSLLTILDIRKQRNRLKRTTT